MENLGYYNGRYDLIERMTVPMNDRACYFGDGIFEVIYTRNHIPYAMDEHMDRLYAGANELGIQIPLTKQEFSDLLGELIGKVDADEQLVYWQVSRGTEMRSHAPQEALTANIWVTIRPMKLRDIYSPMKTITMEDTRFFHCNMKTLNLLPTVLASMRAKEAGADEAIFHRGPRVTECAHSNLSIIREDGALQTAPADRLILPGVARAHLIECCHSFGIPVYEEPFSVEEMMHAREIIVTASGTLCRPVGEIDGVAVGGRAPDLLKKLQDALMGDFMAKTEAPSV
ncbi:MAG: aminotransferase class IV [Clostridia bacterium]|nr:aminotransferase class IV [Clostridia bacterium]